MTSKSGEPFKILFVCTGNTCRSPLAEVLTRRAVERIGWDHVEVSSAGVAAADDAPASPGSLRVAERHGLDLSGHRSARLSLPLVEWADLILTMSPGQLSSVQVAEGASKASVITDFVRGSEGRDESVWGGVPDPLGGGDEEYEGTYRQLTDLVDRVLVRLAPLVAP